MAWEWCRLKQASVDGDTPETCRIYLEQNAFVIEHFGQLRQKRFQPDQSCAYADDERDGATGGVYTYSVAGTHAQGVIKLVWTRAPGPNGCLHVPYLQILKSEPSRGVRGSRPVPALPHGHAIEHALRSFSFQSGAAV